MTAPDLRALVAAAPVEDLPALAGRLAEAQALLELRLREREARQERPPEPSRWLTPGEAASIAGIPHKRIYEWARGKRWASRPSRKCLRIDEAGFRRWLASR